MSTAATWRTQGPARALARGGLAAGALLVLVLLVLPTAPLAPARSAELAVRVEVAADLLAAALVLLRAGTVRRARRGWSLVAAGTLSYGIGELYYLLVLVHPGRPVPFPSAADALWLALYPPLYLAVFHLVRSREARLRFSVALDALVAAVGVAALLGALVVRPALRFADGQVVATAVSVAYPAGDLMLLAALAAGLTVVRWRVGAAVWAFSAGLVVFVLTDLVYLSQKASGTHHGHDFTHAGNAAGLLLLALAAWCPSPVVPGQRSSGPAVVLVPLLSAGVGVALLVDAGLHGGAPPAVVGTAAAAVLLSLARTMITFHEVQVLHRASSQARSEARTDDLTGLPNRRAFVERVTAVAAEQQVFAVLVIDLDRFKEINDSFGHATGDELLRLVGQRLRHPLPPEALLCRLGGDEFGVVLPGAGSSAATAAAQGVSDALGEPFVLDGVPLHLDASTGIAVRPDHGAEPAQLLTAADSAMYQAKRGHLGYALFTDDTDVGSRARLETLEELREAVSRGQLLNHYQPKIDVRTGRVIGAEALVRWQHPGRGLIFPDSFLPLAEQAGLMPVLTLEVLRRALVDARGWRAGGLDLHVAVNLSVSNLADPDLVSQVAGLLAATGLPADALVLEITETGLMVDMEVSHRALSELRDLGVPLAVDDYGTGYSSLSYLHDLPVQELKLDRSFVTHLPTDARAAAIVRSTVHLAHELGMTIVAEGVEDAATMAMLASTDCDLAQGYHVARPMDAGAFTAWLAARPGTAARPDTGAAVAGTSADRGATAG